MPEPRNQYNPDYAVSPGWLLEEHLQARGFSQSELARRCGRSVKLINEIVAGIAPVEPATALQFEKVLGLKAHSWLGIETRYKLHKARQSDTKKAAASSEWGKSFPVAELVRRGCFEMPVSDADAVLKLHAFFRVASTDAWTRRYGSANVAYRHSPSFASDEFSLASWLRLGEMQAEQQECVAFDARRFKQAARDIRSLTGEPVRQALRQAVALCNQSGVALAVVKPFAKTALSGAAWWLTPRKAIIQLSLRYKSDDHLWFSFFHEAAHILVHSKKSVFVDGTGKGDGELEAEANGWAAHMLVPRSRWQRFVSETPKSEPEIRAFADRVGIAPGIVVGMLQHDGQLPWNTRLNRLKRRFKWTSD